jgi:alkylhydroperoxidase family enzyme
LFQPVSKISETLTAAKKGRPSMSEPRIPPRPVAEWDAEVRDALSVLAPPENAAARAAEARAAAARAAKSAQAALPQTALPAGERPRRPVSNMVGIFTWHPALTKAFLTFNNHLFRSALSDRAREMVTVRVGWLRRSEYEWAQHVAMARAAGMSEEEISGISEGPGWQGWSPLEAALLRAVDEMVADRYIGDETWEALAKHLDRKELMDLVFTVGTYDLLAMAFNTFGLELDPGMTGFPASEELD